MGGATYDIENIQARCDAGRYPGGCSRNPLLDSVRAFMIPHQRTYSHGRQWAWRILRQYSGPRHHRAASFDDVCQRGPSGDAKRLREHQPHQFSIEIDGGCHELFNLGCGRMDGVKFPIVTTYSLAFGRHHILGDESETTVGILNKSISVSEHVTTFVQK